MEQRQAKIIVIKLRKIAAQMQGRDSRRKERLTNVKKEGEETAARRSSLSSSKMFSQLSMSFYDESTLRRHKQVIMDNCALELPPSFPAAHPPARSKGKLLKSSSKRRKKQLEGALLEHQKDEMDFRTTQESKLVLKDEEEGRRDEGEGRSKQGIKHGVKSLNKDKGSSLEKFKKLLLADIIHSRIRAPKLTAKKQAMNPRKY